MSKVPAHWERMGEAVEIAKGSGCLILGNGDVEDLAHGRKLVEETGVDGVMLGRAVFGHPWLFDESRPRQSITIDEKLELITSHASLYLQLFAGQKNFVSLRKHLLAYANGFRGAKELRFTLQSVGSYEEVIEIVESFRKNLPISEV